MRAVFKPSVVSGTINAPSSKSMSHRLLICAGLSKGRSVISNIAYSQDVLATLDCLEALGVKYERKEDKVIIDGIDPLSMNIEKTLLCRECGSTMRFFVPICLISAKKAQLTGSERLLARPMTIYSELCREKKLDFSVTGEGVFTKGPLMSGTYVIPGNVSSQFISGLLFALPLLDGNSEIVITEGLESASYIDLTIQALSMFGVVVKRDSKRVIHIEGGQKYKPTNVTVEADYSNAAFLDALNYVGSNVSVTGLNEESLQGDRIYKNYFFELNHGNSIMSLADCPDLGPVLFSLAGALYGAVFTNTERLRIKESDRIAELAEELNKFGITTIDDKSRNVVEIVPPPGEIKEPSGALYGHNDHRIVMALSVLLMKTGGSIEGISAVNKSFPDFFDRLKSIGAEIVIEGD